VAGLDVDREPRKAVKNERKKNAVAAGRLD